MPKKGFKKYFKIYMQVALEDPVLMVSHFIITAQPNSCSNMNTLSHNLTLIVTK